MGDIRWKRRDVVYCIAILTDQKQEGQKCSEYIRNYSLCTPFIRIVCAMSFFTVFENIYSVRTDMSAEKTDKFINLLVRCMVIECGYKCFIYDQFILYDCLHVVFLLNVVLILFFYIQARWKVLLLFSALPFNVLPFVILIIKESEFFSIILSRNDRK